MNKAEKYLKERNEKYGEVREFRLYEYGSMADVKYYNPRWFSRDNIRFFGTRVVGGLRKGNLFITSETDLRGEKRLYTVRLAVVYSDGKHEIETIGDFNAITTLAKARYILKEYQGGIRGFIGG